MVEKSWLSIQTPSTYYLFLYVPLSRIISNLYRKLRRSSPVPIFLEYPNRYPSILLVIFYIYPLYLLNSPFDCFDAICFPLLTWKQLCIWIHCNSATFKFSWQFCWSSLIWYPEKFPYCFRLQIPVMLAVNLATSFCY